MKISDLLRTGAENATPRKHLQTITGMSERAIRRMIEYERNHGIPICADNQNGYFLPSCEDEKDRCVRSMRHRAKEINATADAIDAAEV